MRILALAIAVCAVPVDASAGNVSMKVNTAAATDAWHEGRATPFVVELTGLRRVDTRIACHGETNGYYRAHVARDGVATPLAMDAVVKAVQVDEHLSCSAYQGDREVASWAGRVAWPAMTLPDQRMTKLVTSRCGATWCVDVEIDRTHPGSIGAELEVLCKLRNPTTDPAIARVAPRTRAKVRTRDAHTRVKVDVMAGATVMTCSLDRLHNLPRFADADPKNNVSQTAVVNPPVMARVAVVSGVRDARWHEGCGNCSTPIRGTVALTTRVRNDGPDNIAGAAVRCVPDGTPFVLSGASEPIGVGETKDVVVATELSADVTKLLVGSIKTRCELVVWDALPAKSPPVWSGVVRFK